MKKKHKTSSWKGKNVWFWEEMVSTYLVFKKSPAAKVAIKLIAFILRNVLSIIVRKIFSYIFPNF